MVELVAELGYRAVTVRGLTRLAGVSSRAFYAHFADKEECFLGTYDQLARRLARRLARSQHAPDDWRRGLREGLQALAQGFAAEPKVARLLLAEGFAVGPSAATSMAHAAALLESVIKAPLERAPAGETMPPFAAAAIVSGTTRVARLHLLAGRIEDLPASVEELEAWALSYACGSDQGNGRVRSSSRVGSQRARGRENGQLNSWGGDVERSLILGATAKLATRGGYGALSPAKIRVAAGVSRRAFEDRFDDVASCFVAAVEELAKEAISEVVVVADETESWATGLLLTIRAFCDRIARDRTLARLLFVEDAMAGSEGLRHRERLISDAVERLGETLPVAQRSSRLQAEASAGAVWDAIQRQVAAGRAARLPDQVDRLGFLLLAPLLGGARATEEISTSHPPAHSQRRDIEAV